MANIGLVADYGSSSDNESDEENAWTKTDKQEERSIISGASSETSVNFFESVPDEDEDKDVFDVRPTNGQKKSLLKKALVNPLRNDSISKSFVDSSSSVFYNPFKKEQEAKKSVLEKHVKLTNNPRDVLEINGKKICWNYRKGRCKFGHNCKYAHDSDLVGGVPIQQTHHSPVSDSYGVCNSSVGLVPNESEEFKKRKPGLGDGLVPNKRSRKTYKDIRSKETPWMNQR